MKPIAAKIPENLDQNLFAVRVTELPFFSTEFHFHKECQMVYQIEGEGKRIIGDSVESFGPGELTFLGSDIPHVWYSDKLSSPKDENENHARSVAVFFHPQKLIQSLSQFLPTHRLEATLVKAKRGIKYIGHIKNDLQQLILQLPHEKDFNRLLTFIKILDLISNTSEFELLATQGYVNTYDSKDNERMDKVFQFLFNNFSENIQLDDVASVANMNKQAFCRYFKERTQKTMVNFINEIRISHACKLINNGETYITGISYKCGFNSLSNFNRFFKEIKGVTPREYIKSTKL